MFGIQPCKSAMRFASVGWVESKAGTWLLWLGAPLLLLVAASAILLTALRRRATAPLPPLSDEERERLKSLLGG